MVGATEVGGNPNGRILDRCVDVRRMRPDDRGSDAEMVGRPACPNDCRKYFMGGVLWEGGNEWIWSCYCCGWGRKTKVAP